MNPDPETQERTPRGQGELLRERLVRAALELLDQQGDPSQISIRALTRKAGVSPTAFYLHFEQREDLIAEVVDRCFLSFRDALRAGVAAGVDPTDRLQRAGLAYFAHAREHPERYAMIFGPHTPQSVAEGEKPPAAEDAFGDLLMLVGDYAGEGLSEARTEILARGIWTGMHGFVTLCQCRPQMQWPSEEEFTSELMRAWLGEPRL